MGGQAALALGGKQAFFEQPRLQGVEGQPQCAVAGGLHAVDDQLIIAAPFVQADPAAHAYLQPVVQGHAYTTGVLAEEGAANLRLAVLEAEIQVTGGGAGEVGQLALDPDLRENVFQQAACPGVELADAEHVTFFGQALEQGVIIHDAILACGRLAENN